MSRGNGNAKLFVRRARTVRKITSARFGWRSYRVLGHYALDGASDVARCRFDGDVVRVKRKRTNFLDQRLFCVLCGQLVDQKLDFRVLCMEFLEHFFRRPNQDARLFGALRGQG